MTKKKKINKPTIQATDRRRFDALLGLATKQRGPKEYQTSAPKKDDGYSETETRKRTNEDTSD